MSQAAAFAASVPQPGHDHVHLPHLAHHFDTPEQQYSSAKLGMWVFLGTEILMFGGLFCAYGVYRYSHPDVFMFAHQALSTFWGGINTMVLITSSLTMAMAVRYAPLGKTAALVLCLALTLLGGAAFMAIKAVEYHTKWEHHLFPGKYNVFNPAFAGEVPPPEDLAALEHATLQPVPHEPPSSPAASSHQPNTTSPTTPPALGWPYDDPLAGTPDEPKIKPAFNAPSGLSQQQIAVARSGHITRSQLGALDQARINTFFSVYFMMTGLHGLHVLVGMGLIAWVLVRSTRGVFGPNYFTPVDLVGLYWHLVDLIWIFLFPLLYLIH